MSLFFTSDSNSLSSDRSWSQKYSRRVKVGDFDVNKAVYLRKLLVFMSFYSQTFSSNMFKHMNSYVFGSETESRAQNRGMFGSNSLEFIICANCQSPWLNTNDSFSLIHTSIIIIEHDLNFLFFEPSASWSSIQLDGMIHFNYRLKLIITQLLSSSLCFEWNDFLNLTHVNVTQY